MTDDGLPDQPDQTARPDQTRPPDQTNGDGLDLIRIGEAARILGVSAGYVRKIPESDLPVFTRLGPRRHRRYRRADVLAYRNRMNEDAQ